MGYEQPLFKVSIFASDDDRTSVAGNQFYGVALGTAKNIVGHGQGNAAVVYPTAGGSIVGILQNNPLQGEACEMMWKGISKAKATGAFSVGDDLAVDAQGGFVKASGGAAVVATALEQAAVGDITTVYLR
jgi:hypothetical protein